MLRRDKSHRIDQIWTKKESLSSFIQSTNFGEVPGTVPKAMDTPTGQDSKEFSALRTGGHWTRTGNAYGAVMCALRESKRDCCLRRGNKGALRLSGETSWKMHLWLLNLFLIANDSPWLSSRIFLVPPLPPPPGVREILKDALMYN